MEILNESSLNFRKRLSLAIVFIFIFNMFSFVSFKASAVDTNPLLLEIEKKSAIVSSPSGDEIVFTIKYSTSSTTVDVNNGIITDILPPNLEYVRYSTNNDGSIESVDISDPKNIKFIFKDGTPAGGTGTLSVTAKFKEGVTVNGEKATNSASFQADNASTKTSAYDVTASVNAPTWSIIKTVSSPTSTPALGQPVTYKIELTGNPKIGGANMNNVIIKDTLPVGATYVSSSDSGVNTNGIITWPSITLNAGDKLYRYVTVTYSDPSFTISNTVTNTSSATGIVHGETTPITIIDDVSHGFANPTPGIANFIKGARRPNDEYSLGQTAEFYISNIKNSGNVSLDSMDIVDNIPSQIKLTSISTGKYNLDANIKVYYKTNKKSNESLWSATTYNKDSNAILQVSSLGLATDEYVTEVRWNYTNGLAGIAAGFSDTTALSIKGEIISGPTITNTADLTAKKVGFADIFKSAQASINVISDIPWIVPTKNSYNPITDSLQTNFFMKNQVKYKLNIKNHQWATGDYIKPVAIDLVPVELENITGFTYARNGTDITNDITLTKTLVTIGGKNYDKLLWKYNGTLKPGESIDISYIATIKDLTDTGLLTNELYITSNDAPNGFQNNGDLINDVNDLDGDLFTNDRLAKTTEDIFVRFQGSLTAEKWQKGELDTAWNKSGKTLPGGSANYKLIIKNDNTNGPISNIVIIDKLPYVGDTGVKDPNPRGSQWSPYLVNTITGENGAALPTGVKVYYSIEPTVSGVELYDPPNSSGKASDKWTETPPLDITSVRNIKIELKGVTIQKGGQAIVEWPMRVPAGTPLDSIAWNSFAYGATYTDFQGGNLIQEPFLPAEPVKVGFAVYQNPDSKHSLGNYVFVDMNKDGIQNDGETGINNILVNLYEHDGTTLIGYTRTGFDHNGKPSYYVFPNLGDGYYDVEFIYPKDYKVTKMNIGDDLLDSDIDPINAQIGTSSNSIKALDVLLNGADNFSIDAGFYKVASLGDKVWRDEILTGATDLSTNRDGIQNNSEPGIANVTVNLLNGDGSQVLATTKTNASGNYLFSNLDPGDYIIEFVNPDGNYKFSPSGSGAVSTGSDGLQTTGSATRTSVISLKSEEVNNDIDQGMYKARLGDRLWHDINADGSQTGEAGIGSKIVKLLDESNNLIKSTTTDGSGYYQFTDLNPGNYKVSFDGVTGYAKASPKDIGLDTADSDIDRTSKITDVITLAVGDSNQTIDAGFYNLVSIGDRVWNDKNADGVQDTGEISIGGATVNLLDATGNFIKTTTTDSSGNYSFALLDPGSYIVQFINPDSTKYIFTETTGSDDTKNSDADKTSGKTKIITLTSGQSTIDIDAGFHKGIIGDKVWEDKNYDGKQGDSNSAVSGVKVELIGSDGSTVIGTTTTDSNGNYYFYDLDGGDYSVRFSNLPTFTASQFGKVVTPIFTIKDAGTDDSLDSDVDTATSKTATISLPVGGINKTLDAGIYYPAILGDYVWEDLNGDGQQKAEEPKISGVTVTLYKGILSTGLTTTTDINGKYFFDGLVPGTYSVMFTKPDNFDAFTLKDAGSDSTDSDANRGTGLTGGVTLSSKGQNSTLDAGFVNYIEVGDFLWRDININGKQDDGEIGVPDLKVSIYKVGNGTPLSIITTDVDGKYLFDKTKQLLPGSYYVTFESLSGYKFTLKNQGTDDEKDSDVDGTGKSDSKLVNSGTKDISFDGGIYKLASVGDRTFEDLNGNGIQEGTDLNYAGITLKLYKSNGTYVDVKVSGVDGSYKFDNIEPGSYYIEATIPSGYVVTNKGQGTDIVLDSDFDIKTFKTDIFTLGEGEYNPNLDLGIYKGATLGDFLWLDKNADGKQDAGETGIPGVKVELYDSINNLLGATYTDGLGGYLFTNLRVGVYYVKFDTINYQVSPINSTSGDKDSDIGSTGLTGSITLGVGEVNKNIDAGLYKLASLGDKVWLDKNKDGIQNNSEPGIAGVTVSLWDGSQTITTITDSNGNYSFTELVPGNYTVSFAPPETGYKVTLKDQGTDGFDSDIDSSFKTGTVTLQSGETNNTIDAGFTVKAAISIDKKVYEGKYSNGTLGKEIATGKNGEWVTYIFEITNTGDTYLKDIEVSDPAIKITRVNMTKISGVEPLAPGAKISFYYETTVNGTLPNEASTTGTPTDKDGNVIPNVDKPGAKDTALVNALGSIGDYVWYDNNGDGVQDVGEIGIPNVTLKLLDKNGVAIKDLEGKDVIAITDKDGKYIFDRLPEGEYQIVIDTATLPIGLKETAEKDGTFNGVVSVGLTPGQIIEDVDFGYYILGKIGDYVWEDNNGNGLQDDGEAPIKDVVVTLYKEDGTKVKETNTDASGLYSFIDLEIGKYYVTFTSPEGYEFTINAPGNEDSDSNPDSTGETSLITVIAGTDDKTIDAGLYKPASIGDKFWNDIDGDGIQDEGETGIPGIKVILKDKDGKEIGTATTDENGNYMFKDLLPGEYSVVVDKTSLPEGLIQTFEIDSSKDGTVKVTVNSGDEKKDVDFGYYKLGKIGDYVWEDINGNGLQDEGEAPIKDVVVTLYKEDGTKVGEINTDVNGLYSFIDLEIGKYYVTFTSPEGYEFTINAPGNLGNDSNPDSTGKTSLITVIAGTDDKTIDAGLYKPASIGDKFWNDIDGDGVLDEGETGIPGIKVILKDKDGKEITTTTDENGNYMFKDLLPGEYEVVVDKTTLPEGMIQTFELDSSKDGSVKVTIKSGDEKKDIDFGYYKLGKIGDYVWEDINGNGLQDEGEAPLKDVLVILYKEDNTKVKEIVTDANGLYSFIDLEIGTYYVTFTSPEGYEFTINAPENEGNDSNPDNTGKTSLITVIAGTDDKTIDAGLYKPASIGDYVWLDKNHNGIQDNGEDAFNNVVVNLLNGEGSPVLDEEGNKITTITDENGKYLFANLIPGDYKVEFITPEGYKLSPSEKGESNVIDSDPNILTGTTKVISLKSGENIGTIDAGIYKITTVGGTIIDDKTGNPIVGATVIIKDKDGNVIGESTTDLDGKFEITELPVGETVIVTIKKEGYIDETFEIEITDDPVPLAEAIVQVPVIPKTGSEYYNLLLLGAILFIMTSYLLIEDNKKRKRSALRKYRR